MVGGQSAILRGERGAGLVGELLGMELDPEAVLAGRAEQALDLVRGESDGVAERIDAGRQPALAMAGIISSTTIVT